MPLQIPVCLRILDTYLDTWAPSPHTRFPKLDLIAVGAFTESYRIGKTARKTYALYGRDEALTAQNMRAIRNEASVYIILKGHPRIAKCLSVCPWKTYVDLEYYPNGNLKKHLNEPLCGVRISRANLEMWARQMIESVAFIHGMGVRHSNLRLEKWALDSTMNARLSDFSSAGFDGNPELGIKGSQAEGVETISHHLPRDRAEDSTVHTDLFALGSALYELVSGKLPFEGEMYEDVDRWFAEGRFPDVKGILFEDLILGCWRRGFASADDLLEYGRVIYDL